MQCLTTEFPLKTERLVLRPFMERDLPSFVAYRKDPTVARYQSWTTYDMDRAIAFLREQQAGEWGRAGHWCQLAVVRRTDAVHLGDVVLCVDPTDPCQAEVGFTFATAHQGQGYATEALVALLKLAFGGLGLYRITATTDAENGPAMALLNRAGFRKEGHYHQNIFFKGAWGDECAFAILESEWTSLGA